MRRARRRLRLTVAASRPVLAALGGIALVVAGCAGRIPAAHYGNSPESTCARLAGAGATPVQPAPADADALLALVAGSGKGHVLWYAPAADRLLACRYGRPYGCNTHAHEFARVAGEWRWQPERSRVEMCIIQ